MLDAIAAGGVAASPAVAGAVNQTQALVDALRALPDSVAGMSATIQGAVELLRDNFKEARCAGHAALGMLRCAGAALLVAMQLSCAATSPPGRWGAAGVGPGQLPPGQDGARRAGHTGPPPVRFACLPADDCGHYGFI